MVWAIYRVVRLFKKLSDRIVNKIMITVHIVDYLILIIVNLLLNYVPLDDLRAQEIFKICEIAIYSVDDVIFGMIIY